MTGDLRRILLVEDDPDVQRVAKMALEAVGGFEVIACGSGAEALASVAAFAPDLILLDVMMPGMDGPALLAALRELPAARGAPAVFLTAKVQARETARYRELGAGVIAKPFDPMTLASQVRAIWRELRSEGAGMSDGAEDLRGYFAGRLHERLREIEEAWRAARAAGWTGEPLRLFHRLAHSLAGAGATFGFPAVTETSRELEQRLKAVIQGSPPAEIEIERLLNRLRQAARS